MADSDSFLRVALKNHAQYVVQLVRKGQNRLQKFGVPLESPVGGILLGGLFPWIAATGKIDQYDAQGPYVVRSTSVGWLPRRLIQAL